MTAFGEILVASAVGTLYMLYTGGLGGFEWTVSLMLTQGADWWLSFIVGDRKAVEDVPEDVPEAESLFSPDSACSPSRRIKAVVQNHMAV